MSASRRISFVLPTLDLSGGVRVISMLARELQSMGHEVLVVAGPPVRPLVRDRIRAAVRGRQHRWWSDPDKHHFVDLGVPIRRLEQSRPVRDADLPESDFVVATWWKTAEAVAALSPDRGVKCYYAQHHEIHMEGQPHDRVNATYRLPLHLFACSQWVREQIEPIAGRPVPVASYGIDRTVFDAPARGKNATPTIGFMYSDVAFKGAEVTLEALHAARHQMPQLRVVAFGSHAERPHLRLPEGAILEIAPWQDRIAEIYASCDAWLVGSHAEGFGLPMLEAFACRTPLITTRTGGAIDLVQEGANGFTVPVGDSAAMSTRILDIARLSDSAWSSMSRAAYDTAAARTWARAAELFLRQLETARTAQSVPGDRA